MITGMSQAQKQEEKKPKKIGISLPHKLKFQNASVAKWKPNRY